MGDHLAVLHIGLFNIPTDILHNIQREPGPTVDELWNGRKSSVGRVEIKYWSDIVPSNATKRVLQFLTCTCTYQQSVRNHGLLFELKQLVNFTSDIHEDIQVDIVALNEDE